MNCVCTLLQITDLEVEAETRTEHLQSPEQDQNGSVTVDDVDDIQKVNRELEQQLSEKNKVRLLMFVHLLISNIVK